MLPDALQHQEEKGRRASEGKQSVDRTDRAEAPPGFRQHDISALREYYPAALEAFEDWTLPSAWAFVGAFPTPQALVSAGKRKWEKFLNTQQLARPQTYTKRTITLGRAAESSPASPYSCQESLGFSARENAARAPEPDRLLPCRD